MCVMWNLEFALAHLSAVVKLNIELIQKLKLFQIILSQRTYTINLSKCN